MRILLPYWNVSLYHCALFPRRVDAQVKAYAPLGATREEDDFWCHVSLQRQLVMVLSARTSTGQPRDVPLPSHAMIKCPHTLKIISTRIQNSKFVRIGVLALSATTVTSPGGALLECGLEPQVASTDDHQSAVSHAATALCFP